VCQHRPQLGNPAAGEFMEISQAIAVRNVMQMSGVIMAYNGTVSDELMVSLAEILKARLEGRDDTKRSRTVFSVFMEGMQNLIWHGRTEQAATGMVCISEHEGEIVVVCGNQIARADSIKLKSVLEQLQGADKDTIRQLYREGMSRSSDHEGPGAGLGLLEIARRATHPISFVFTDIDDQYVDFFLSARI
jgi:hypothetical protein